MARFVKHGVFRDGNGKIVASGTVVVSKTGETAATTDIYEASSGGSAVTSITTGTDGTFIFYVDDTGTLTTGQKFRITLSKTNYQTKTFDDILIIGFT